MTDLVADRMASEQIENRGIRNSDVLRVMRSTLRHLFVPTRFRSEAYEDYPLSRACPVSLSFA